MSVIDYLTQYTDYWSYKPYYCGCRSTYTFKSRDEFCRHMKKHHSIMIAPKFLKRKVDEIDDGEETVIKEFKRYDD